MRFSILISSLLLSGTWVIAEPQAAAATTVPITADSGSGSDGSNGSTTTTSTPSPTPTPSSPTSTPTNLPNSQQLSSILYTIEHDLSYIASKVPTSLRTIAAYSEVTAALASAQTMSSLVPQLVASLEQNPGALSTLVVEYSSLAVVMSSLSSLGGAAPAAPTPGIMAARAGGAAAAVGMAALVLI